jgi:predicted ABC-type ATPase
MKKPQLYVFAGPNGAGKSTLSASMVPPGTPIFDGDKELALLRRQFPDVDSGNLYDAVNGHIYEDWKNRAIQSATDCAFETNFRMEQVMKSVEQFKNGGYETRLIFFGLDSIESSVDRVKLRVAQGGHEVSLDNIRENYDKGLKNLGLFYQGFDSVHLYQNYEDREQTIRSVPLMAIENGQIKEQALTLPDWAKALVQILEQKQSQQIKQNIKQEKQQDRNNDLKLGSGYGKKDNEQSKGLSL